MAKKTPAIKASLASIALILALTFELAAADPVLIGEVIENGASSSCCIPAGFALTGLGFNLMYDARSSTGGTKTCGIDADVEMGGEVTWLSGQTGFVDFDVSSRDFSALVARMTNGIDEMLFRGQVATFANGGCAGGGSSAGLESTAFDGVNTSSDLIGFNIGFIRLLVHKVQFSHADAGGGFISTMREWDVTWQIWSGQPMFSGGGQRSDVDDFLAFVNPLQRTTQLDPGTTSFSVTVVYGSNIDPVTFEASVNGAPFTGFHPIPGTRETVAIPLSPGRNTLNVQINGIRNDGRTATDRDTLVFVVP